MLRLALLITIVLLAACESLPRDAFRLSESALATRELQTREYEASDAQILSASAAVLQDMGYAIDEVETRLGVLSASKRADASSTAREIGTFALDAMQCALTFMLGCTGNHYAEIDDVQDIRLTLVTRPQREGERTVSVRVTMQRIVWDKRGRLTERETIADSKVYESFFAKLSKAVFLEKEAV